MPKKNDFKLDVVSVRLVKDAPIYSLVKKDALLGLLDAEYEWPWYGQLMKVPQTIAYMLQIDFWLRHYNIEIIG